MKTCKLNDFLEAVKPWIDSAYIRNAYLNSDGHFVLAFIDGVKNTYQIDDCDTGQLERILKDFQQKGIAVLK
jgi:hypothetical protein